MTTSARPALAVARPVIVGLTGLNLLYALVLVVMLVYSFTIDIWTALGFEMQRLHPWAAVGLRTIVVIGVAGAGLAHVVLRRLLAIVDTVRAGDPFIAANVHRLRTIAWCVLAGEGLRLLVAAIVTAVYEPFKVEAFSFAPWLAVLLLFVLAGVFAQGTKMREDLEGTV
jgi:hypothetical protein